MLADLSSNVRPSSSRPDTNRSKLFLSTKAVNETQVSHFRDHALPRINSLLVSTNPLRIKVNAAHSNIAHNNVLFRLTAIVSENGRFRFQNIVVTD